MSEGRRTIGRGGVPLGEVVGHHPLDHGGKLGSNRIRLVHDGWSSRALASPSPRGPWIMSRSTGPRPTRACWASPRIASMSKPAARSSGSSAAPGSSKEPKSNSPRLWVLGPRRPGADPQQFHRVPSTRDDQVGCRDLSWGRADAPSACWSARAACSARATRLPRLQGAMLFQELGQSDPVHPLP